MAELGLREMVWPVLRFMSFSGQLLPERKPLQILQWVITAGSLVCLTILASVELFITASTKLGPALEILTILLTFLEMCFRVMYFSYHESQIRKVILSCHYFPVTCSAFIYSERQMRNRAMRLSRRTQLLFSGYVFFVLAGYLSLPFLPQGPDFGFDATSDITASIVNPTRKRPLYIPMWFPVDIETIQSPGYEAIVIWQAWSFVVLVCAFCAADCLLYTFITFIVEGLKHLGRVIPGRPNRRHRQIPLGVFSSDLVAWRMRAEQHNYKEQSDLEYHVWVQQHQFLLSLGEEVEKLFSPIIFGTFLINGAVLCVLAYVLVKLRNIVGILCVTGHLSCIVIKLYVMAKFGQQLSDQVCSIALSYFIVLLQLH